jgi:hypothetical protein
MATVPEANHSTAALIDKHHEAMADDPHRDHLGASMLGHKCERYLWLSFRWSFREQIPGRIRRLFRRGHNEEASIISDLRAIGCVVHDRMADGRQHRVELAPHVGGSLDAIIDSGVPEAPKARHVAEFKTHSRKSFDDLVANGVAKSKPLHHVQMQTYMYGMGIDRALYVAVCKDDDRLHVERVERDRSIAEKYIERGARIALAERMPPGISDDPSWYECKFCPAHDMCHGSRKTTLINCRTCAHSTPGGDGQWRCARWGDETIPSDAQRIGCGSHVFHPDLVPWQLHDSGIEWVALWKIDGAMVANGEADANVYSSCEILGETDAA